MHHNNHDQSAAIIRLLAQEAAQSIWIAKTVVVVVVCAWPNVAHDRSEQQKCIGNVNEGSRKTM